MNGYEMWKQTQEDMKFEDKNIIIQLLVRPEMEHVDTTLLTKSSGRCTYSWTSWTVRKVKVFMAEKPKEYCGKVKLLESCEFGEYSLESYQEAVNYFKKLVSNTL